MTLYHPLGFHPIIIHHTAFFQFCTNFQYLAYTCLIHVWKTVLGSNTRTRLVCTKGDTRFLIKVGIETSARQVSTFGHTKWYKYWSFSKKISCQSGTGIGSFLKYSYQPGLGSTYEAGTRSRLVLPQVPTRQVLVWAGIIASGRTGLVVSLIPEVVSVYIPSVASQHSSGPHGQCRVLCGENV